MSKSVTLSFELSVEEVSNLDSQGILEEILNKAEDQGREQFKSLYGHYPVNEKYQFRLSYEVDSVLFRVTIFDPYILTATRFLADEVMIMMDEQDFEALIAADLNRLNKDFEDQYWNCKADPDTADVQITQHPDLHGVALEFSIAEKVFGE